MVGMTASPHHASVRAQRSEAFDRVRRTFRWTTAGAVATVALIVGVVSARGPGPGELSGDRHQRLDRHQCPSRHHRSICHGPISHSSHVRQRELIWHIESVGRCDKPASDCTCSQSESADGRVGWDFTLRRGTVLSLA